MKRVITIHGINSSGKWQEEIKAILGPYFECISIKYPHYRHFGALKIVLEPWMLMVLTPVVFALMLFSAFGPLVNSILVFSALTICCWTSGWRRRKAFQSFKEQLDTSLLYGGRPHVIAHSLGTYLTGELLRRFPDVRFSHMVLAGCVLSKQFDWQRVREINPQAFKRIRNEIATRDRIVRLAFFLEGLILGFGHAGVVGFRGDGRLIHNIPSPNVLCTGCTEPRTQASIHNVLCPELGHGDHFIGRNHAATYWLPFFWDIEPPEYGHFLDLCLTLADLEDENDWANLTIVEEELLEWEWKWAEGSLEKFIGSQLFVRMSSKFPYPDAIVPRVLRLMWRAVREAKEAQRQNGSDVQKLKRLNPRIAVTFAVDAVMRQG